VFRFTLEKERRRLLDLSSDELGPISIAVIQGDLVALEFVRSTLSDEEWNELINRPADGIWFTPLCCALLLDNQAMATRLLDLGAKARFVEGSNTLVQYLAMVDAHKAVLFLKKLDFEGFVGCRVKYRRMDLATIADDDIPILAQIMCEDLLTEHVPDFSTLLSNNYLSILLHPKKLSLYRKCFSGVNPYETRVLFQQAGVLFQRFCVNQKDEYKQKDVEPSFLVLINDFIKPEFEELNLKPATSGFLFLGEAHILWPVKLLLKHVPDLVDMPIDNREHSTPLDLACEADNVQLVKLLLELDAEISQASITRALSSPAILQLLVKAGAQFDLDQIDEAFNSGLWSQVLPLILQNSPSVSCLKPPAVPSSPTNAVPEIFPFVSLLDTLASMVFVVFFKPPSVLPPETHTQALKTFIRLSTAAMTACAEFWKLVVAVEHKESLFHSRQIAVSYFGLLKLHIRLLFSASKFELMLSEATAMLNDPTKVAWCTESYLQTVCLLACHMCLNVKGAKKYSVLLEYGPNSVDPWLHDYIYPIWQRYQNEVEDASKAAKKASAPPSGGKKQAPQPAAKKSTLPPKALATQVNNSNAKSTESTSKDSKLVQSLEKEAKSSTSTKEEAPSKSAKSSTKAVPSKGTAKAESAPSAAAKAPSKQVGETKRANTSAPVNPKATADAPKDVTQSSQSIAVGPPVASLNAGLQAVGQPEVSPNAAVQGHRTNISLPECAICMDRIPDHAINCGHTFCGVCAAELKECAVCRQPVKAVIRLFFL
jgi:hypothetical protein